MIIFVSSSRRISYILLFCLFMNMLKGLHVLFYPFDRRDPQCTRSVHQLYMPCFHMLLYTQTFNSSSSKSLFSISLFLFYVAEVVSWGGAKIIASSVSANFFCYIKIMSNSQHHIVITNHFIHHFPTGAYVWVGVPLGSIPCSFSCTYFWCMCYLCYRVWDQI